MLGQDLKNETQARQEALRSLILEGVAANQKEFCKALKQKKYEVTQSTVSRDLRRIGAIKTVNKEGETIYMLPEQQQSLLPPTVSQGLGGLLKSVEANDSLIVVRTTPGSASLVARYIDGLSAELGVLGTIAGDDTIFVAPAMGKKIPALIKRIKSEF